MKPQEKLELILSINGKTVAIKDISNNTMVDEIVQDIKIQQKYYPERDYRIERSPYVKL